jgi:hypothetical protein
MDPRVNENQTKTDTNTNRKREGGESGKKQKEETRILKRN